MCIIQISFLSFHLNQRKHFCLFSNSPLSYLDFPRFILFKLKRCTYTKFIISDSYFYIISINNNNSYIQTFQIFILFCIFCFPLLFVCFLFIIFEIEQTRFSVVSFQCTKGSKLNVEWNSFWTIYMNNKLNLIHNIIIDNFIDDNSELLHLINIFK